MKLLLTSNGVNNQTIANSLSELVGKQPMDIKIGFIPTAVHAEQGSKEWFVKQLTDLHSFGFCYVDFIDIIAPNIDWQEKLSEVDVVYGGGGNPYYLMDAIKKTGFDDWLKVNIERKVYVGGSAGSMIVTPNIGTTQIKSFGSVNTTNSENLQAIGLVDIEIAPHVPDWPTYDEVEAYAEMTKNKVYAIDNQSGVRVIDKKVDVVGEGEWKIFN